MAVLKTHRNHVERWQCAGETGFIERFNILWHTAYVDQRDRQGYKSVVSLR